MDSWKNLSLGWQFGIVAAIAIAIVLAGYYMIFQEQHQDIRRLEEKLSKLKEDVQQARILARKEPELRKEIADLQLKLEELKAVIPPVRDPANLLDRLKSLADRSRLEIRNTKWDRLREEEFYKTYPARMQVSGGYHDLAIFFDRLSRESRIFNVSNLSVKSSRNSARNTIEADFVATTFVFKEEEETTKRSGGSGSPRS